MGHGRRIGRPGLPGPLPTILAMVEQVLLAEPRGFCAGVEMAIKALTWMTRIFPPPVYCYHEIVHNAAVVAAFEADPLVFHGRFPVRTGAEILWALRRIRRRMEAIEVPLLLLHGTGDMVTDPDGSRQLHVRAGSADKTLRFYEGLYHDLFHEPEKERVLDDVLEWLGARLANS